jgi:hypothetical protein
MTFGPAQVAPGVEVIGTTGSPIGRVKEVRDENFVVERAAPGSDVTLGYDEIRAILGNQIVLNRGPDQLP